MKPDWKTRLQDIDGIDLKEGDRFVTASTVACRALDATLADEQQLTTEVKLERWDLMLRIRDGGEIDNSEIRLIKERVGKAFSPSIVGAMRAILNESKVVAKIPKVERSVS